MAQATPGDLLTLEQIAALGRFDGKGARVMSVYLDLPPERQRNAGLLTAFKDLVQSLPDHSARDEAQHVAARLGHVEGRGLAIFSCAQHAFWHVQPLPVPVTDHIAFERTADIGPLITLLDDYQRYAVVLVDKARARLFTVQLGAIEEHQSLYEDLPPKHDQGGMSQARLQRHHEEHVHWHLKDVVERLEQLARAQPFDRLVLAGPVEPLSEFRSLLPRALADRLVEAASLEFTANADDVLAKTLEIEQRAEREQEERVVEQLAEAVAHQRGARGLAATLRAIYLGNVLTLVVAANAHSEGAECLNPDCGLLEQQPVDTCPACSGAMAPTRHVVHRAMARALDQGGSVEVVHDRAAERLIEHDGLGAIFRFENPLSATSSAPRASR